MTTKIRTIHIEAQLDIAPSVIASKLVQTVSKKKYQQEKQINKPKNYQFICVHFIDLI